MELLEEIRNTALNIRHSDADTDKKISGIIARGQRKLSDIAGKKLDFSEEATPKALLMDYVRYVWNDSFSDFEKDFKSELINLRLLYGADRNEKEESETA